MKRRSIEEIKRHLLASRNINPETGCWEWTGSLNTAGYGQMQAASITGIVRMPIGVHRVAAVLWLDYDIKSELIVCHRCDRPICFNPNHLFIGTDADNIHDASLKGRMRHVLTDAKLKEITELLKLKIRPKKIARITGVSSASVYDVKFLRIHKRACVLLGWFGDHERVGRKLSDGDILKIKDLLAQGHTQASIAKKFNVHYSTICRIHKGNRRQTALQQEAANVG